MAINRSDITNIDTAKKLKYNNQDLTGQEKAIFDQLGTSPGLDKIKDTAELLETAILAKASSAFSLELYGKLTEGLTKNPDSVKAINSNGNQFQKAIDYQLEKRGTDDINDTKDKTKLSEAEIEARIKTLKIQQAGLDRMYTDEQKKIDDNIGQASTHERNIRKFTEEKAKIEEFKNLLEGKDVPTGTPKLLNANATAAKIKTAAEATLKKIIDDTKTNLNKPGKFYKTKIRSYYSQEKGGHLYVGKGHLWEFNREVMDCFKKIGDVRMKQVINSHLSGSDKASALALWEKIEKAQWGIDNYTNDASSWMYNWRCHRIAFKGNFAENNLIFVGSEASYPQDVLKITDGTSNSDAIWPYVGLKEKNFFDFMNLFVPRDHYSEDSTAFNTTNPITKDLDDLDFTIRFFGTPFDLTDGLSGDNLKIRNIVMKKILEKKYGTDAPKYLKTVVLENIKLRSVLGLFWDIYHDDTIIKDWDNQPNNVEITVSNFSSLCLDFTKSLRDSNIGISKDDVSDSMIEKVTKLTTSFFYNYGKDAVFGNEGSSRSKLYSETRLGGSKGDWRDYIDTTPLENKLIELEDKIDAETIKRDQWKSMRKDWIEKQTSYSHQKQDKQHEIDELTKQLGILKTKDVVQLKADFRKDYAGELKDKERPLINRLIVCLRQIDELEKTRQKASGEPETGLVEDDLKTAKGVLDTLHNNLKDHEGVMQMFETYGKTSKERALHKDLDDAQLRDVYKKAFDAVAALRKLASSEQDDLNAINLKLEGKLKDDAPTDSDLSEEKLKIIFGFDIDKTLLESWKKVGTQILLEQKIKDGVGKYAKKTNKANFDALMAHLKDQGDGFNGENKDDYKDAGGDDTKKDKVWETFIKKGPKVVIETIVAHEFEELKKDATKLQAKKDEIKGKDKIKLDEYSKDGKEVDEDGVKKFLYQVKIGQEYTKMPIESPVPKEDGGKKTGEEKEAWFWPLHGGWKNWVAWGGTGVVVIGAACVAIFWQNISEWWNGPVEEEGKISEGEEKENEE